MYARIGYKALDFIPKTFGIKNKQVSNVLAKGFDGIADSVKLTSQRVKNLELYNSSGTRNNLFNFKKNGSIKVSPRVYGSDDLQFLEHIKNNQYVKPKIHAEGSLRCSKRGIEQSNKLAKEIIAENECLIDGFRYCGQRAKFDNFGRNISRFRNGNQEIVVIDRTLDDTLVKTINAFKSRIDGKNLTDEQKVNELMKFIDEVFSASKSGKQISEYVDMMEGQHVEVLLGDIINSGAGVCRHRALLTKVLADETNLKCRFIEGFYGSGGHAWNEIVTNGDTYLFDAMHGNIFNVGNTSRNLAPQVFPYRITNPKDTNALIPKYFDNNSTVGILYRCIKHKTPIKSSEAILTPSPNGYHIKPLTDNVFVNGKKISGVKELSLGDFVNLKDIGFEII